jgi:Protein of unknown function (DUF4232)
MRAAARLGWRVAAVVAFGATAALAVTLTRGAPMHAALISARNHDAAPRCAASGLRISLGAVPAAATGVRRGPTSYALDFTNVSDAKCELRGYPAVAAYLASGAQVGNAAAADTTATAHRVVLAPGETARAPRPRRPRAAAGRLSRRDCASPRRESRPPASSGTACWRVPPRARGRRSSCASGPSSRTRRPGSWTPLPSRPAGRGSAPVRRALSCGSTTTPQAPLPQASRCWPPAWPDSGAGRILRRVPPIRSWQCRGQWES